MMQNAQDTEDKNGSSPPDSLFSCFSFFVSANAHPI